MARLNVKIAPDAHAAWMAHCHEQGVTSSEAIRELIEQRVSTVPPPLRPRTTRKEQPKVQVSASFTEFEFENIRQRAAFAGVTRAAWIIRAVRVELARKPMFDDVGVVLALRESTHQVLALGKNLNQIARRLNEGQKAEQALDVSKVKQLIDGHASTVQAVIDASQSREDIPA